jgi:DNA-binding NarL/FixJ family response regulator
VAAPRALIAITVEEMRDSVVRAASPIVAVVRTVAAAEEAAEVIETTSADFDLAIVDIAALRALLRRIRRGRAEQPSIATPLVLVLELAELQDALAMLHLCHGIVFWEDDPQKLESMFVLALDGYSAAPAALLPDLVTDRVRLGLIERLAPIERQALELLGNALSNRAIAARLDISEPLAKSLVRTVLTKLRLKNRTEAAVLVARWRHPVGSESARDLAVTETPPL